MYYHSYDQRQQCYRLGLATSPDGFRWTKKGVVFSGSDDPEAHDGAGAAAHHIVRDVETKQYVMFYEAMAKGGRRSIGLAVSDDGLDSWKRLPQPVLSTAEQDDGAWDGGSVGCPCAVPMSAGRWRLYYGAKQATGPGPWEGIGLALSVEGSELFEGVPASFKRRAGRVQ